VTYIPVSTQKTIIMAGLEVLATTFCDVMLPSSVAAELAVGLLLDYIRLYIPEDSVLQ
jgi:hypothetical protein